MASVSWIMVVVGLGLFGPDMTTERGLVDPNGRVRMFNQDGDSRPRTWDRTLANWLRDLFVAPQPSHLTPDRVHGGIGP